MQYSDETITEFIKYKTYIDSLKEIQKLYKGKYQTEMTLELSGLEKTYGLAYLDLLALHNNEKTIDKKHKIINSSLKEINGTLSKNAERKANLISELPVTINKLSDLIIKIYLTKIKLQHTDLCINIDSINSLKYITDDKSVIVEEIIDADVIRKINEKNNNMFKTHGFMSSLNPNNIYDMTNSYSAKKLIDLYIEKGILSSNQFEAFANIEPTAIVKFDGNDIKQLNPGDIAKKYIDTYFESQITNSSNNVVLYDQIENDVDKPFIATVIRDKIDSTKGKVQLIIVTHDPIIAVNADPVRYIECKKDKNNVISYRDFLPESSKNELNTIAEIVDGSEVVIKNRYEIYQGERK
jgi:hypothetical protein